MVFQYSVNPEFFDVFPLIHILNIATESCSHGSFIASFISRESNFLLLNTIFGYSKTKITERLNVFICIISIIILPDFSIF